MIINHQKIRALDAINQPWMPQAPHVLDHGNLFPLLYLPQKFSDGFFRFSQGDVCGEGSGGGEMK